MVREVIIFYAQKYKFKNMYFNFLTLWVRDNIFFSLNLSIFPQLWNCRTQMFSKHSQNPQKAKSAYMLLLSTETILQSAISTAEQYNCYHSKTTL